MNIKKNFWAVFAVMAAGCGGGGSEQTIPPGGDPEDHGGDYYLEFVTGPQIDVSRSAEATLTVRYMSPKDEPVTDGSIWFDVEGDGRGSTLDSAGGSTNDDGEGTVHLRAGSNVADFEVVATADYADAITFRIHVAEGEGKGSLRVSLTYEGIRRLHGADVYLYEGGDCEDIDPNAPPPADLLQSVQSIRDDATFEGMEPASRWTILAAAVNETGHVAAWSCYPEAVIADQGETVVDLPLQDIPLSSEGRWELENHFDAGEALPDNVANIFEALAEMSDDPNDPATFLLDTIRDQIDNDGLRLAFDAARIYFDLDEDLNQQILDVAPDFAIDALQAGGDLGRALADLQIDSDLRLGQPDEFGVINADHQLIDLVLSLDGVTNRFSMANDVGVQATTARNVLITVVDEHELQIERHEFRVGLGTIVLFALNNMVLPRFSGSPESISELLENVVDCDSVGDWLADTVDMGSPSTWEDICGFGLAAASLYAEQQLLTLNDGYDTLTLEGTAEIKDPNGDLGFDRIDEGVWTSTWSGASGSVQFPGAFEGNRY